MCSRHPARYARGDRPAQVVRRRSFRRCVFGATVTPAYVAVARRRTDAPASHSTEVEQPRGLSPCARRAGLLQSRRPVGRAECVRRSDRTTRPALRPSHRNAARGTRLPMTIAIPEYVDGLPTIAGHEAELDKAIRAAAEKEVFRPESKIDFGRIKSACAIALHMHQPLIPAGGHDLRTAAIISNLQYMMDNQGIGDNHNAPVFVWCYKRMGEFIPQLIDEGKEPRVMLEYSGTLLHGMRQMGLNDVFDALKRATCDPAYRRGIEWLGCPWGHAVAPSTPVQDYPPARQGVAAPLRRHLRHRGAGAGARLLAVGDGVAESSGRRLRVRQDAARLRLHLGAGAGTHRRAAGEWSRPGEEAPAAPPRLHQLRRRDGGDHRADQDAGLRHQAGGADAALLRGEEPVALGTGRQERAAAGHPDRRRRERRGDDERVPAQVLRGACARRPARRRR